MTVSLDTPEQISAWVLLSRMHQLALEINCPGLKAARGSVLKDCQRLGWTDKRTKRGALEDLVKLMQERVDPEYTPDSSTIGRALEKK